MAQTAYRIQHSSAAVQQMLEKVAKATGKPTAALAVIGETGVDLVHDAFRTQTSPYGAKWPALSPRTLAARKAKGHKGEFALMRTRLFRNSFQWSLSPDGKGVRIGTDKRFAKYHQGDPDHPSKGIIPQRSFLPEKHKSLPKVWREAIVESLQEHLDAVTTA
jgi:phage gpG-like protein